MPKLLRIGSSPRCDIRLDSQYVSGLHAEMTIFEDGKILLEDKSRNGTTVGNRRLEQGVETEVQRGDRIVFADQQLVWAKVPAADKLTGYKLVYNIGTNYRNEIIINGQTASRYHASLRIKDGKAFIHDNGSRNGTTVNGVKIPAKTDFRIKKGDNIMCGAEDVTSSITPYIPSNSFGKIAAISGSAIAVAAIIAGIVYYIISGMNPSAADLRSAVVYVDAKYHFIAEFEENPLSDTWDGKINDIPASIKYSGTAFFLDKEGRMATNRHVAVPWEYRTAETDSKIRTIIDERLDLTKKICLFMITGDTRGVSQSEVEEFSKTALCDAIMKHIAKSSNPRLELLNIIKRLAASKYTVTGSIDEICVGYPGRNYTHTDEFQRCTPVCDSKDKDIDLAILQLNDKSTPKSVKFIFDPSKFKTEELVPQKDDLLTIGYPAGLEMNLDEKSQSLEPGIRSTKCSKNSKYDFEVQETTMGGSSGSPVCLKNGSIVGVLYGGYFVAGGSTSAVKAKFLKKMYEEEVGL